MKIFLITIILIVGPYCQIVKSQTNSQNVSWWKISELFNSILHNALYKRELQDAIEEDFTWTENEINPNEALKEYFDRVEVIIKNKYEALNKFHKAVVEAYKDFKVEKPRIHCCTHHSQDSTELAGCFHGKGVETSIIANIPEKLEQEIRNIVFVYKEVKDLYIGLSDGSMYYYPPDSVYQRTDEYQQHCDNYQPHVRPWFLLAASPRPRDVILMIDLNSDEDEVTRKLNLLVAKTALESLSTDDRIVIATRKPLIYYNERWRHIQSNVWLVATARNINRLVDWLDGIIIKNKTPEDIDFYDFQSPESRVETVKILIENPFKLDINITRREPEKVLIQIGGRTNLNCIKKEIWQKNNITKPKIITYYTGREKVNNCQNQSETETLLWIRQESDLEIEENKLRSFFKWSDYLNDTENKVDPKEVRITMPYKGWYDLENQFSVMLPLIIDGQFIGVVSSDFFVSFIPSELQSTMGISDSYSFLIDNQGRALFHPFLPSGFCSKDHKRGYIFCQEPTLEYINHLEPEIEILQSMLNMESGNKTIQGAISLATGIVSKSMSNSVTSRPTQLYYSWRALKFINLSIALVLPMTNNKIFKASSTCKDPNKCESPNFRYHLDIKDVEHKKCSYFGAEVIKEEALTKLPASAFRDQISYLWYPDDPVMKALAEDKPLSSVFKSKQILKNINMVGSLGKIWKRGRNLTCYVGNRYACTRDGVCLFYPGISLTNEYDATKRSWLQSGIANAVEKNTMSLTLPYIDYFSGGIVITLVTSIDKKFESGFKAPAALAAADFSLAFLSDRIRSVLPECNGLNLDCFLMDSAGYIPLHLHRPKDIDMHITEIEPLFASNLIKANFLRRTGCHDYERDSIFLYWTFNLPYGVTRYSYKPSNTTCFSIYEIPYMNIYLIAKDHLDKQHSTKKKRTSNTPECATTCSEGVEPPCQIFSDIGCPNSSDKNMRELFLHIPTCLPNDESDNLGAKETCQYAEPDTCYLQNTKQCTFWKLVC